MKHARDEFLLAIAAAIALIIAPALIPVTQQSSGQQQVEEQQDDDVTPGPPSVGANVTHAIILAEKPFLIEHGRTVAANPINQTHIQISLAGNGTITLPNSTETVMTKDIGSAIARLTPTGNIAQGQIHISTEDGSENATVFFTEIGQNEKGIGVAYFTTNSTGRLAFLDNMVGVIQDEVQPNGDTFITAWEWIGEQSEGGGK
jgi:hypothetical protein